MFRIGPKPSSLPDHCMPMRLQQHDEQVYLRMLRSVLASQHIYFSYTYDITNSAQVCPRWRPPHTYTQRTLGDRLSVL